MTEGVFKLQRYTQDEDVWGFFMMDEDPKGAWVRWEDVEPLVKAYLTLNYKLSEIKHVLSNTIVVNTECGFTQDGMKVIDLNPKYKGI